MNERVLFGLCRRYVYETLDKGGDRNKIAVLLNYSTFIAFRVSALESSFALTMDRNFAPTTHWFLYAGVFVSWSPLIVDPAGYAFANILK